MAPMELIKYTFDNDANTLAARGAALQAAQQLADLRGLLLFGRTTDDLSLVVEDQWIDEGQVGDGVVR